MGKFFEYAWLPLTPRGVALFARAKLGRLWLVQFIVALFAAAVTVWVVNRAWLPVVRDAIHQLPAQGEIRGGLLNWRGESPCLLAEGHWLAFSVDTNRTGEIRSPAHVQVEFHEDGFSIHSFLGYAEEFYPRDWTAEFNRTRLEPGWGAWKPMLLAGVVLAVLAGLAVSWTALATVYFLPVWLAGYFANRDLNFRSSWKLAGAALMPGALFLTGAIFIYGLGLIDLVQLGGALVTHFIIGWIYVFLAPFFVSKNSGGAPPKGNPFVARER